ncbi:MAG: thymidine phosphorylase [Spirochaetota bacterium]
MRPVEVIIKKRNGKAHTVDEIEFMVKGYTEGEIPDYQVSAWLMACFLNGLNEEETFFLTRAMLRSGNIFDLSSIPKPKVDKHSTGGVGDKISLVLAPAVAACGVAVPMTSGRALGFSGGTLDKLESIPGFNVNLTEEEFIDILNEVGYVMSGQTRTLAPADKKLYALRDVTGTVEFIPFITSSILSKKLAEGAEAIVVDVKFGSGAFMKTIEDARRLAHSVVDIAERLGRKVIAVISSMEQPLGKAVGNSLEVIESIECLRGGGPEDVVELVGVLGGLMLLCAGFVDSAPEGKVMVLEKLKNGEALERFKHSVRRQGGDVSSIENPEKLPEAALKTKVKTRREGYVVSIDTEAIGTACMYLGAGRLKTDDSIDHACGIIIEKKIGDRVTEGEAIATLHYNRALYLERAVQLVEKAYIIGKKPQSEFRLIHGVIDKHNR